jgi:phosphoglycerol transferase MdoB-like AlkP superfamily enzyme/glycerophosphoryl diester phosphodiesterase
MFVITLAWALLVVLGERDIAETGWPLERAVLSASLAVLLAAWAVALALPRPWRLPFSGTCLGIATGLAIVDAVALRHYQDVLSVGDWQSLSNLPLAGPSVLTYITASDAVLLLPLVAAGAVLPWHRTASDALTSRRRFVLAAACALLATIVGWPAARLIARDPDTVFEFAFQRREIVSALGLPAYHLYDTGEYLGRRLLREQVRRTTNLNALALQWPVASPRRPFAGSGAGANVVLISLESFQQFVIGLEIDGQAVAPNLTRLAAEGIQFTRVIDQTLRGTTSDAEWLALQSLHPLGAGAVATRRGDISLHSLPEVLRAEGYATLSAVAEPPGYWNMGRFHKRLGFDESLFAEAFAPAPWIGVGLADGRFLPAMGERLSRHVEPFMAFLLTSSSHHPFTIPNDEQRLRLGALDGTTLGNYLHSVHYADRALGGLLDALRASGRLERTLLVAYGDHSASLLLTPSEIPAAMSAMPELRSADPAFCRWWLRSSVPLVIRLPGATVRGTRDVVAGQSDITPTILGILGVAGRGPWMGRDLLADHVAPVVFTRSGVVAETHQVALPEAQGGGCYTWAGEATACRRIGPLRERARAMLAHSDAIIEGDLIEPLAAAIAERERARRPAAHPVLVIAHRGDSLRLPENTSAAILSAFDAGADLVEIDIRRTRDGEVVVFHDDDLSRIAGRPGRVEDLRLADFLALDVGRWFAPAYADTRPLTLERALELARPRGGVLLDLKNERLGPAVAEAVARTGFPVRSILIGGWTATQRQEFRRLLPGARLLRTEDPPAPWTPALWTGARLEGAWGWEFDGGAPAEFVDAVARSGLAPIAYTVNDEAAMRRLIEAGVAGIETDNPALLRKVVDSLGVGTRPEEPKPPFSDRW